MTDLSHGCDLHSPSTFSVFKSLISKMPLEETLRHRYFIKAAGDRYVTLLRYEPHFDPVVDGVSSLPLFRRFS